MSPNERILILGGGGMLAHAFRHLLPSSHSVHAPARNEVDICDYPCLASIFDRVNPTLVLNCAAHTKVDLCDFQKDLAHAINATAAGQAAKLAAHHNAKFVHFSTDFVFSKSDHPHKETDPTHPLSEYGRSKLQGELLVRANHPHPLILRTSWLYGPGGPCFPATMIRLARQHKPLSIVADQHGSPTFTYDLARTTLELLEKAPEGGTFHVSNAGETTWHDFTAEILRVFHCPTELSKITSHDWQQKTPWSAHRPPRSTMDLTKTQSTLGHPLRPWKEALKEYHSLNPI